MDHVHPRLERAAVIPGEDGGIGQEMDGQKRTDRNEARERKQPIDEELVAF
jgi:hypothetical protein